MENCGLLEGFFAEMRSYFVPAIAVAMIMPGILSARSDDIPTLDVRPVCRGIASQSALEVGLQQTSFEQCVQSEQAVREEVKKEWSTFSAADKQHCVALAKTEGGTIYLNTSRCRATLSIDGGIEAELPVLLDRCSHGSVGKSQITSGAPQELYWCRGGTL